MNVDEFFDNLRELIISEQKKKGRRTDKTRLAFAETVICMIRGFFGDRPRKSRSRKRNCMVKIDNSKIRGPDGMVDERGVARMDERHSASPNDPVVN